MVSGHFESPPPTKNFLIKKLFTVFEKVEGAKKILINCLKGECVACWGPTLPLLLPRCPGRTFGSSFATLQFPSFVGGRFSLTDDSSKSRISFLAALDRRLF